MCVCVNVSMYIHTYTHIYIYMWVYMYIYISTYMYKYIYLHLCLCFYIEMWMDSRELGIPSYFESIQISSYKSHVYLEFIQNSRIQNNLEKSPLILHPFKSKFEWVQENLEFPKYSQSHLGWHFRMLFQSSKLKARTSLFTETWQKRRSSFQLWAFENDTPIGIGCTKNPFKSEVTNPRCILNPFKFRGFIITR